MSLSNRILEVLKDRIVVTRSLLVEILEKPRTTIFDHLRRLKEQHLIASVRAVPKDGSFPKGRPQVLYFRTDLTEEAKEKTVDIRGIKFIADPLEMT